MKPVPAEFNPTEYTPISFDQLLHGYSSLRAGELVRVEGFFWQFLTYDPALKYYYANQLKYPRHWGDLEWFALYEKADMKGYYDRGAMSHLQRLQFNPKGWITSSFTARWFPWAAASFISWCTTWSVNN